MLTAVTVQTTTRNQGCILIFNTTNFLNGHRTYKSYHMWSLVQPVNISIVIYSLQMTILDGRDGRPLLKPYPRDSVGAQTSPLTISAEGEGNDLYLYWIADCVGHEGAGGEFGFRKGTLKIL